MPREAVVRSVTEFVTRQSRGVRPRRFQRQPCDTCGSRGHSTARCTGRDDLVLGTSSPGANGEYRGDAVVRVVPPGFSYLDRYERGEQRPIERGQVWFSPDGKGYVVDRVKVRIVHLLRRRAAKFALAPTRVKVSTLQRLWYFGGTEVTHG